MSDPITLNLLRLLEQETTNFILAAIPHMLQLPTDEFEQLLPILTAAREHLKGEYSEFPTQGKGDDDATTKK